ncbi:zinc finger protein 23-like [Hyposmocoma kahamanoa]|uniref:zinc finger protein 23-like n=1 Tax=Hyposmocoma kahamanoa TaxID=1477025 RepID=UPI000E6D8B82|nr:zinc finger protein 23-like [Hyposmocoma kahamanoa]
MDIHDFRQLVELKPDLEPLNTICRCCMTTGKRMKNVVLFSAFFRDLAGINVTESDGLPQWLCYECSALLIKAVRFKHKLIRAHTLLNEYLNRCAPFPIDAQDVELSKYSTPPLSATTTLSFDVAGKARIGYHRVLQHKKQILKTELDGILLPAPVHDVPFVSAANDVSKVEENVKTELDFSDYEDNITLEEYRSNVKLTEEEVSKITEDDLAQLLQESESLELTEKNGDGDKKKRRGRKKEDKVKKRKTRDVRKEEPVEKKSSIRKPIELDPTKIRVVTLNPEEQVKQREEESKANLKFPYQCNFCFKGFNFEAKLQNHMGKHSPSRGQFECKLCRMYLPTSYSYSVHSLIHTRRYECLQCGRRMIDRASILDHYKSQHEGIMTVYTCHICGKVSNNSKTHRGHMRNHHSGDRPKCDQCGKSFVNKDSLSEHLQIHEGIKNYSCWVCGARFRTRAQIKHHQLKHTDAKEFYCVECDTRFKSAHSLRQHLQKSLKHKDKQSLKFCCSRCDKRFDTEARLQHHVNVQHEGIRSHRCPHCTATLATRSSLQKHVHSVHRGHRPPPRHVCDTCGKAFRGKSVLTNHVRTHTGEKPFECSTCGRKFTQRTALRTHFNLVHLKIRRTAKIKPELPLEVREPPKLESALPNMFPKAETPIVFESWSRQPIPSCEVYFHVTAGPQ